MQMFRTYAEQNMLEIDRANWVRYYATNEEHSLEVSVSPNADLDAQIFFAWCHDIDEYITIDGYAFDWEVA